MTPDSSSQPGPALPAFGPTVTILFSDIRGFTEYTDEHGDEAAYRMLQHHNGLVQEQIALHRGRIVKTLGDSFMVAFDSARVAVTCAVGIQRSLHDYNRSQTGDKIEIGIGISTGEPVSEAGDFFGGTVNLASRICAAAGSGRVLVSETVRQLVGRIEGSEYVDRGFFEIKGFATPQHLFEVDWSGAGAVRAPRVEAGASSTRQAASYPAPSEAQGARRKPLLLGAAILALLLAASIGAVSFMANRGGAGPREVTGEESFDQGPAWKLLRSDDFSSPIRGLFMDKQSGTSGGAFGDGTPYEYRWEYGYADNALVAVLRGLYPERPGAFPYRGIAAADRIPGDFAVEVRGRATRKPDRARYAIDYVVAGEDRYRFEIAPGPSSYGIHLGPMRRNFMASGRTGAVHQADEENHLRMEVRGDTMTVFANGEELDQGQHAGLARRGGTIELVAGMFGTLTDSDVEVRFTDFRVYTLQR